MNKIFLITGANGHLGSAICAYLSERCEKVRALVLPNEKTDFLESIGVEICHGDVREKADLQRFFQGTEGMERYVIHAAGIVDIATEHSDRMTDVNVNGTKNVLAVCRECGVKRLVYVSSVHAIPERAKYRVIEECRRFDPDKVVGAYAKTKAEATQAVLDAVADGLDAVVVHPSGILGPYLGDGNYLVQMVENYVNGKLPIIVRGGYDFVDVRDCAFGCVQAALQGKTGECYILSNRYYEIRDLFRIMREMTNGKRFGIVSLKLAKAFAPMCASAAKRKGKKPLYTKYSLYTLTANGTFSHDKATAELNYRPREIYETLADTVQWLKAHGKILARKAVKIKRTASC